MSVTKLKQQQLDTDSVGPTQLVSTAVAAGAYASPHLTVDADGRVIAATGGAAWPVGSVFVSVLSDNPATLLGYGTWVSVAAGRVLVGLDATDTDFDTVEEVGGSKTHSLSPNEVP